MCVIELEAILVNATFALLQMCKARQGDMPGNMRL